MADPLLSSSLAVEMFSGEERIRQQQEAMPRRFGNETNPYLIPVYDPSVRPTYKAPARHVAARALMQVLGDVDVTPEHFIAVVNAERRRDRQHQQQQQQLLLQQQDDDAVMQYEDDEEERQQEHKCEHHHHNDDAHEQQQQEQDDDEKDDPITSPLRRKLVAARHFADLHRRICTECRFEHRSRLEAAQKKMFDKEYKARDNLYLEQDAARKEIRVLYTEPHTRITRYLEATKKERDRARRLARRQEQQRVFDAEEQAARGAIVNQIYLDLTRMLEQGCTSVMQFIAMEERVDRKDILKFQRAERHVVNIGSHLRAEKLRRIESEMLSVVRGVEPQARRMVDAEYDRGVQRLLHWNLEDIEVVHSFVHNQKLAAQAQARSVLEKEENEARTKEQMADEIRARDLMMQWRTADRAKIHIEQLAAKRAKLDASEAGTRRQFERIFAQLLASLYLNMIPSVEAGARYAVRLEAWESLKDIYNEFGVDLVC